MRNVIALFLFAATVVCTVGCVNGDATATKAEQGNYSDRNPAHYKGPPAGFHGGSPPAGKMGGPPSGAKPPASSGG